MRLDGMWRATHSCLRLTVEVATSHSPYTPRSRQHGRDADVAHSFGELSENLQEWPPPTTRQLIDQDDGIDPDVGDYHAVGSSLAPHMLRLCLCLLYMKAMSGNAKNHNPGIERKTSPAE